MKRILFALVLGVFRVTRKVADADLDTVRVRAIRNQSGGRTVRNVPKPRVRISRGWAIAALLFAVQVQAGLLNPRLRVDATFSAVEAINTEVEVPSSLADDAGGLGFTIIIFRGLDIFGQGALAARANRDPYLAFRYDLTNFTDATQFFFLRLAVDTVNTGPIVESDAFMDWRIIDTDGSGAASVSDGQVAANLGTDVGAFLSFATPLSPPAESGILNISGVDALVVMDQTGATPDPADFFGSNFFTSLEMQALGFVSPGDTVVIQGFACIADVTQSCPVRPDLNSLFASAVPVPAAIWLFGSALGILGWLRRKSA